MIGWDKRIGGPQGDSRRHRVEFSAIKNNNKRRKRKNWGVMRSRGHPAKRWPQTGKPVGLIMAFSLF